MLVPSMPWQRSCWHARNYKITESKHISSCRLRIAAPRVRGMSIDVKECPLPAAASQTSNCLREIYTACFGHSIISGYCYRFAYHSRVPQNCSTTRKRWHSPILLCSCVYDAASQNFALLRCYNMLKYCCMLSRELKEQIQIRTPIIDPTIRISYHCTIAHPMVPLAPVPACL